MSIWRFLHRARWDAERAREIETYLGIEIDENIARGMTPEDARRAAYRKFGNPTLIREEIYRMNTISFLETLWQDLRYGARLLRGNPTFAVVAILTLALGTGANTAIFQLVDAVRLRTLPVKNPHELVEIVINTHDRGRTGRFVSRRPRLTMPLFEQIASQQRVFSGIAAWTAVTFDLASGGESRPAAGIWVNGDFFQTLGVNAQIGRLITRADDRRDCTAPPAVLSDGFWRAEYGANAGVIGRQITFDGHAYDIIGVTEPSFFGAEVGRSFDVAVPLCAEPLSRGAQSGLDKRDVWFLAAFGRLAPGIERAQAEAQLAATSKAIFEATAPATYVPDDLEAYLAFTLTATPAGTGVSPLRADYETPLWVLLGVTGLVLLIACANLANLMLARATAREREIAVRLAIGASRRRVLRQMLSESLLIAICGAAGGVMLARWMSRFLVAFLSTDDAPLFVDLTLDWRVLLFTLGLAVAACLLFGLAPAVRATAADPGATMKAGCRGTTDGHERFTLRRALVVVQVALSLVLVVGALLFARSLQNLLHTDPGFRQHGVLIANMDVRRANVAPESRRAVYAAIVERLRNIPGAIDAVEAFIVPISGSGWNNRIVVDGARRQGTVNFNSVGAGFFRAMGTPFVAGRDFSAADTPQSPRVAVVNESFAKRDFPRGQALGRSFQIEQDGGKRSETYQVIGIVKDTKYSDIREDFPPIAYLAIDQEERDFPFLSVVIRSDAGLAAVASGATRALAEVNPAILVQYQTMAAQVRNSLTRERLMATLSGFFGTLAALIATIGLYGVMSYVVAQRRVEIGIRMALGATGESVTALIVREAGVLVAAGLIVGYGLAVMAARSAGSMLYGLQPWDPAALVAAGLGLAAVAGFASWLPARRAARLEPTAALRQD